MGKRWKKRFRDICCWSTAPSDSNVEGDGTQNAPKARTDEPDVEVPDVKVEVDPSQQPATMAEINALKQQMDEIYESLSKRITDLSTDMMEQRKWLDERINVYIMRELERKGPPQFPGWFKYPLSQNDSDGFSPGQPTSSPPRFTESRYTTTDGSAPSRGLSSTSTMISKSSSDSQSGSDVSFSSCVTSRSTRTTMRISNVSPPDSMGSFTITNGSKSTTSDISLPSSGSSLTSPMKSRSTVSDAPKQSTRSPYRSSSSFSFSVPRSITVEGPRSDNSGDEMLQIWKMYKAMNARGAPDGLGNDSEYVSPSTVAQLAVQCRNAAQQNITANTERIAKPAISKQGNEGLISKSDHITDKITKKPLVTTSKDALQEVIKEPLFIQPAQMVEVVTRVPLVSKSDHFLPDVTKESVVSLTECRYRIFTNTKSSVSFQNAVTLQLRHSGRTPTIYQAVTAFWKDTDDMLYLQTLRGHTMTDIQAVTGFQNIVNGPQITMTFTLKDLMEWYKDSWPFLEIHAQFLCICLLRILKDFHSRDIIHGSISPGKVVFTQSGYPRLIQNEALSISDSNTNTVTNLPGPDTSQMDDLSLRPDTSQMDYLSPEHILSGNITEETDIFLVGTLVYTVLCNRPPFKGTTDVQTKANLLDKTFSPDFTDVHVTKDGRYFIRKLLRTAPEARFKLKHCKKSLPNAVKWLNIFEEEDLTEEIFPSPYRDLLLYKTGSGFNKTSQEPG